MKLTVAETPARSGRKGKRSGESTLRVPKSVARAFNKHDRALVPETDTRVMTYSGVINTTTGSVFGAAVGSGLVTSATEFASMATRYQEFRVLAMKLHWVPRFGQANESCAVAESGQPVGCVFIGGVAPSSVAAFLACDGFKVATSTSKHLMLEVDSRVNPNAKFWAPSSASPPAANQFGICVRHPGTCPANLNNTNAIDYYVEFVVQWRTAS